MSRSITPTINSAAVAPGSTVVQQVYTSTGFNAGDYVYAYVSGGNQQVGFGRPSVNVTAFGASISNTAFVTTQAATGAQAAYGPMQEAAVYSGSSMTGGSFLVPATSIESTATFTPKVAVLNDGSIVFVYANYPASSVLTQKVFNSSGTLISGPTTVNSNLGASAAYGIAALTTGGYVITCVQANNTQWAGWYNSSYTQYSAGTYGSAINTGGYFDNTSFADPTTSNAYWANVNPTGSAYYGLFNNTSILSWTTTSTSFTSKQEMVQVLGVLGNARALHLSNGSSNNCTIMNITSGAAGTTLTLPNYVQSTGSTFGFCTSLAGGGRFIYVGSSDGTNLIAYVYQWNGGSTAGSFSIVKTITLNTTGNFSTLCVKPGYDGGFTVTTAGSGGNIVAYIVNYAAGDFTAPVTYQTAITAVSTTTATSTYHATTRSGGLAIGYNNSASFAPSFVIMAAQTLTNGVTPLYGSNTYTPANNYYLLGVAATTAAAGTVGEVIVNGPAALGSTYPSVVNQINFDYSSVGPPSRGNKGYVAGTTAVLKGYE